jgi:hypothetical protein
MPREPEDGGNAPRERATNGGERRGRPQGRYRERRIPGPVRKQGGQEKGTISNTKRQEEQQQPTKQRLRGATASQTRREGRGQASATLYRSAGVFPPLDVCACVAATVAWRRGLEGDGVGGQGRQGLAAVAGVSASDGAAPGPSVVSIPSSATALRSSGNTGFDGSTSQRCTFLAPSSMSTSHLLVSPHPNHHRTLFTFVQHHGLPVERDERVCHGRESS